MLPTDAGTCRHVRHVPGNAVIGYGPYTTAAAFKRSGWNSFFVPDDGIQLPKHVAQLCETIICLLEHHTHTPTTFEIAFRSLLGELHLWPFCGPLGQFYDGFCCHFHICCLGEAFCTTFMCEQALKTPIIDDPDFCAKVLFWTSSHHTSCIAQGFALSKVKVAFSCNSISLLWANIEVHCGFLWLQL